MTQGSVTRAAALRPGANPEQIPDGPSLVLPSEPAEPILHAVLAAGAEPILVFDRRGRVLTGTAAAAQAVGLSLRELPGAGVADLALPDAVRDTLAPELAALLESGASRDEASIPGRKGERCGPGPFLTPVRGPGGEVLGAVCRLGGGAGDSDDRERFGALVDSVNDVVFSLDREMRFTGVYGRWLDAEGVLPAGAIPGRTLRDALGPGRAGPHEEATRRAVAGERVVYDWVVETRPGRRFYQVSLAPIRGGSGAVTGVIGIARDVTDRRHEQEELSRLLDWSRTVKEEWKATLDSLPVFVALVDFAGSVVRGNRTLEAWGLRGPGEISGLELHALLHPGCPGAACYLADAQSRAWNATLEGREVAVEAEDPFLRRFVRASFRPVVRTDAAGAIPTMLAVVEDLSAARQAQLDRDRTDTQLRQAQNLEALAQLAGGLAHEIHTPAQFIGDNLRFLREGTVEMVAALRKAREALALAGEGKLEPAAARELSRGLWASDLEILMREMPAAATQSIEGIDRVAADIQVLKEFSEIGPCRLGRFQVPFSTGPVLPRPPRSASPSRRV
jgi:PAS domain S-box-containing protein